MFVYLQDKKLNIVSDIKICGEFVENCKARKSSTPVPSLDCEDFDNAEYLEDSFYLEHVNG